MKKSIVATATMALGCIVFSCQKKEEKPGSSVKTYAQIEKANWLLGNWGNTTKEGILTENWTKQNDSVFAGESYFVVGKDTVFSEKIALEQKGDSLFYVPVIKNQNQGKPVSFALTSAKGNQLVFENPKHDFPQKVTYTKITADSLVAEISGMKDGKAGKETFPMKKKSY